jgi:hypothetical protein
MTAAVDTRKAATLDLDFIGQPYLMGEVLSGDAPVAPANSSQLKGFP